MKLTALLFLTAAAACNGSLPPTPPGPSPAVPSPVVGHWNLEAPSPGEHLWIESDGAFTEAGGPPLGAPTLGATSGTWTYSAPTLTLDDVQVGAQEFYATVAGSRLTLLSAARVFYYLNRAD